MEVNSDVSGRQPNGGIDVQPLSDPPAGSPMFRAGFVSRSRFLWRPPSQVTRLPSLYQLALDCYATASGMRRFALVDPPDSSSTEEELQIVSTARGLSLTASIGGYRLLLARGEVEPDLLLTHDEARLFLRHIEHRREYLGPRKGLERLLTVCAGGRPDKATKTVLPEELGLDANGGGIPWNVVRLEEEGRGAAREMGVLDPTPPQVLSFGLMEAAKLNPLYLQSADEAAAVVRMALFALPESTDQVSRKQLAYVAHHVRKSLQDHLDDSDEKFEEWIQDPDSNLLHRIAKRADCRCHAIRSNESYWN